MKKIFKRFIIFFLLSLVIVTSVILGLAYRYEDELKSYVIKELQLHLTREIELGIKRMDYSILSHFPHISVEIPDLRIYSFKKGDENLIKLKEISLVFDVFSILKGDLILKEIFLKDGEINIIYNEDGLPNFNIWKTTEKELENKSSVSIENISLIDVAISYQHKVKIQDYKFHLDGLSISPEHISDSIILSSVVKGDIIQIMQSSFILKQLVPMNGQLNFSLVNEVIAFKFNGNLLEKESLISGSIDQSTNDAFWDINFEILNLGISETVSKLPSSIKVTELNDIAGYLDLKGKIKGVKNKRKEPSLEIGFKLNSGSIKSKDYKIDNVTCNGVYFQPKLSSAKEAHIKISDYSFGFGASVFSGELQVRNFSNLWLSTKIKADFNLKDIHETFVKDQFQTLNGQVKLEAELEGNINDILNNSNSTIRYFKSKGNIAFENIELCSNNFSQLIFFKKGALTFNNKHLDIVSLNGKVNSSKFEMTGKVSNFIETVFSNQPITFQSNLKIDKLKVGEFISAKGSTEADSNYFFNLPNGLVLDVKLDLGFFSFRKFKAQNLKGAVLLKNQRLTFDNLKFGTCSGTAKVSGKIDAKYKKKVVFECVTGLDGIDAKQAFIQLENFGQDVLLAKHVKGSVTADIYLLAETDKQLNIVKDKIYTQTKLKISNGELNNFGPLVDLQKFMSDEFKMNFDLKHLKFETLENDIEIIKETIHIPEMAIRTNDVNLDISGKHTFKQEIDYLFKVKHSEIFKASKNNKIEEKYGVIENNDKTATLPLKMTGTVDNPKFSYDIKKKIDIIKKNLKDDFKKAREAISEEIFGNKKLRDKKEKEKDVLNAPRDKVKIKIGGIDDEEEDEKDEDYEVEL
jgi:hypothetical protein